MTRRLRPLAALLVSTACGGGLVNREDKTDDEDPVEGIPNIVVSATAIDFGEVDYGSTGSATLTIQNNGTGSLIVASLDFSDDVFSASAGAGLEVAPGSSTPLGLKYLPIDYDADNATLTINTNDPDQPVVEVALTGSVVTDADGDGYDSEEAGGEDCDDDDADTFPGAPDAWYDGDDSDCQGDDDYDQDGDGYQSEVWNDDPDAGGGDCQDANADIHPGLEDEWYDGVDTDCDGADDFDQDGDGFESEAHGRGADCDDEDASVNPDGYEAFNGKDDDCNDKIDDDVPGWNSDLVYYGTRTGDGAGFGLAMGDLDDDGKDEVIVGSYAYSSGRGHIAIFDGSAMPSTGGDITDGENSFKGSGSSDYLGYEVGWLANFGTDGAGYVAVGAPGTNGNYGAVYVIPAVLAMSGGDTSDAILTVSGVSGTYGVGRGFSQDLDLDGNGIQELFGYYDTSTSYATPALWLLYGDTNGSYTLSTVDARFSTDGASSVEYKTFPTGGDFDGDGYQDALFCDALADYRYTNDGAVWVLPGRVNEYLTSSAESIENHAEVAVSGEQYDRMAYVCAFGDDMDGDGSDELWLFNSGQDSLGVIYGGSDAFDATRSWSDAGVVYEGGASDPEPVSISRVGDWSGDGRSEVALGLEPTSTKAGQIWVYSSEVTSGTWDADRDAFSVIKGDSEDPYFQDAFGFTIAALPGDINGDGAHDFVAGDPEWGDPSSEANTGALYVSYGSP